MATHLQWIVEGLLAFNWWQLFVARSGPLSLRSFARQVAS